MEDPPVKKHRGRKPGSKNKPKPDGDIRPVGKSKPKHFSMVVFKCEGCAWCKFVLGMEPEARCFFVKANEVSFPLPSYQHAIHSKCQLPDWAGKK